MVLLQRRPPKIISNFLLIVVWGYLVACGSKNTTLQEENPKEKNTTEQKASAQDTKAQDAKPMTMLAPQVLATCLPKNFEEYTLDGQISSDSATIKGFKVSSAEAVYKKGGNMLVIVLVDYTEAPQIYGGVSTVWRMGLNMDNEQEKISTITLKKQKGMTRLNKKKKNAELALGIGNRFVLTIKADNQKDATLVESVAERFDFENILKKK